MEHHTHDTIVAIFHKYLVSEWGRTKIPYKLDTALVNATTSEPDSTERIFLNAGFQSWLAYFLATTGEAHFDGRQAQLDALAAFQKYSIEDRKLVATKVAETVPHCTVQVAIDKIMQDPKRRRFLPPTVDHVQEPPFSTSPAHSMSSTILSHPNSTQSVPTASVDTPPSDANPTSFEQQTVFSGGSPQEFASIVPEYMSGAIRRYSDGTTGWKVAVTMTFPYVGKVDCLMSLAIQENKVIYFAMALFGVHIEVNSVVQVVLQNGATLVPSLDFTLQGAQDQAILQLLGSEIYNGIKSSRVNQDEEQQGIRATRCVSMIISRDPRAGAIINLNLGLGAASRIKDKIHKINEA